MTLTDTLDHLLSVFLRPLRSWIEREFVAPWRAAYDAAMQTKEQYRDGVYLHLRERLEGTDEHPLAEGVPVRPLPEVQDLEHLQETVELLDTRKVDTGSLTDGVPDGVSLVRLLCDSSLASQVTELVDTNIKGIMDKPTFVNYIKNNIFPNIAKIVIGSSEIRNSVINGLGDIVLEFPNVEKIDLTDVKGYIGAFQGSSRDIYMPNVKEITSTNTSYTFGTLCYQRTNNDSEHIFNVYLPSIESIQSTVYMFGSYINQGATSPAFSGSKLFIGCRGNRNQLVYINAGQAGGGSDYMACEDLEIGDFENISKGLQPRWYPRQPIRFDRFNRLTAENIVNHIFNRLADNNDGDPITITLGSTNLAKLTDEEKHIAIDKNYILA